MGNRELRRRRQREGDRRVVGIAAARATIRCLL
jgi:hypothetical protein